MTAQSGGDEPIYVISVAARLVELHPQTLRYYERAGLVKPNRSHGRIRLYSQRDIERLRKISRLIDELGVNLAGVEVILNLTEKLEEMQIELARQHPTQIAETMSDETEASVEQAPRKARVNKKPKPTASIITIQRTHRVRNRN